MKILFVLIMTALLTVGSVDLYGNDGAFYAAGNHLIPVNETTVSVKREILKITRVRGDYVEVDVDYQFYNPGPAKTVIVGFEAASPMGDVDATPKNGQHPYMSDFSVVLNNDSLKFKVSLVPDSLFRDRKYYENGKIRKFNYPEIENENYVDFSYVYYFDAHFKTGINHLRHKYVCKLSTYVYIPHNFSYILTAATRWANKQIDDFTLIIDVGDNEELHLERSFFRNSNEWDFDGEATEYIDTTFAEGRELTKFKINKGPLVFKKKKFNPTEELRFESFSYWKHEEVQEVKKNKFKSQPAK